MIVKVAGIYFIYFVGLGFAFQWPFLERKNEQELHAHLPPSPGGSAARTAAAR